MSLPLPDALPWYVAGPLIGLAVPALLLFGSKVFGLSANLRHLCAAVPAPARLKPDFLRYDWRRGGAWNLVFALGIGLGGLLVAVLVGVPDAGAHISKDTRADLPALGVTDFSGLADVQGASLVAVIGFFAGGLLVTHLLLPLVLS